MLWGVLVGKGIETINNYQEKYVAHIWRELSHELLNFYWKFFLDMPTMVWICTSFIKDIRSSSTELFILLGQEKKIAFGSEGFLGFLHILRIIFIIFSLIQLRLI